MMVIVRWFEEQVVVRWRAALAIIRWFAELAIVRWPAAIGLACLTTFALLYTMQVLIAVGQQPNSRPNFVKIADASMPELELEIIKEFERPKLIETIDEPPPEVREKRVKMDAGPKLNISKEAVFSHSEIILQNASISIADVEMLPLLQISPNYPKIALSKEIEGWCLVNFTVSGSGRVIKETVEVMNSRPPYIFDKSCRRAVVRFKYQPRVINGQGVEVTGVSYLFIFKLEDEL